MREGRGKKQGKEIHRGEENVVQKGIERGLGENKHERVKGEMNVKEGWSPRCHRHGS